MNRCTAAGHVLRWHLLGLSFLLLSAACKPLEPVQRIAGDRGGSSGSGGRPGQGGTPPEPSSAGSGGNVASGGASGDGAAGAGAGTGDADVPGAGGSDAGGVTGSGGAPDAGATPGMDASAGAGGTPATGHRFGAHPQAYPPGSIRPAGGQAALDAAVAMAYDKWKAAYVTAGCGGFIVKTKQGEPGE